MYFTLLWCKPYIVYITFFLWLSICKINYVCNGALDSTIHCVHIIRASVFKVVWKWNHWVVFVSLTLVHLRGNREKQKKIWLKIRGKMYKGIRTKQSEKKFW